MALDVLERLWSAEEYLEWESVQTYKNELIDNRIYPMPGASPSHNLICFDLGIALMGQLEPRGCTVFGMEIQLQVDAAATYTYPDVVVACGEVRFRSDTPLPMLENPTLLFEVLSPSTEELDRTLKYERYIQIPSLLGYFLVSQDEPLIEGYTRAGDEWVFGDCAGLDARLRIPALDCEIPLREVYRRVDFKQN